MPFEITPQHEQELIEAINAYPLEDTRDEMRAAYNTDGLDRSQMMQGVYVIHFSQPLKHAKHYIGYADDIERRFREHKKGRGARLTQVVVDAGIHLVLANVFPNADRTFERRLKKGRTA